MELIAEAPDEAKARELSNELWEIWIKAPDDLAQEILQSGMERRSSFDFLGALDDFNKLVGYCPDYAEGYNQRAFVHFLREEYQEALGDLDRTLEIVPDHIGALSGKALTYLRMGREREGQLALREALELNPWLPERAELRDMPAEELKPGETDL